MNDTLRALMERHLPGREFASIDIERAAMDVTSDRPADAVSYAPGLHRYYLVATDGARVEISNDEAHAVMKIGYTAA